MVNSVWTYELWNLIAFRCYAIAWNVNLTHIGTNFNKILIKIEAFEENALENVVRQMSEILHLWVVKFNCLFGTKPELGGIILSHVDMNLENFWYLTDLRATRDRVQLK